MTTVTSTEAKNHFGKFLDSAQQEPVIVEKNGRKAAVLISISTFEEMERLEEEVMQRRLQESINEAKLGKRISATQVHADLMSM